MSHHTLQEWLNIATAGLCDEARARVTAEYQDHIAGAISTAQNNGLDLEESEYAAVAALGNPKAVRRKLSATNITESEAVWLETIKGLSSGWTIAVSLAGAVSIVLLPYFVLIKTIFPNADRLDFYQLTFTFMFPFLARLLYRRRLQLSLQRACRIAAIIQTSVGAVAGSAGLSASVRTFGAHPYNAAFSLLLSFIFFGLGVYDAWRFVNKIGRINEDVNA